MSSYEGAWTSTPGPSGQAPDNLSASYSSSEDENVLTWDADPSNPQDIVRCQTTGASATCEPTNTIDTVSAGVGTYNDTGITTGNDETYCYKVVSAAGSSNVDCAATGTSA